MDIRVIKQENFSLTQPQQPRLPIPLPLMVSEEGSFAYYTITKRLPAIVKRVIAENDFPLFLVENLQLLAKELFDGFVRPLTKDKGPDVTTWASYIEPFQGKRWFDVPFYFAEAYFYRRILEATNYFQTRQQYGVDPFALQKRQSLQTSIDSIRSISQRVNILGRHPNDKKDKTSLTTLLYLALWGNRIDLSFWPAGTEDNNHSQIAAYSEQANILMDDTPILADLICNFQGVRIDFILDNAGFELFCDLYLVDFLLVTQTAEKIYLHLKAHPTFVSDAMSKDVHYMLEVLATDKDSQVRSLAFRLQDYITTGRLVCREDFFWTTPLAFWEMPTLMRLELDQARLIFVKGDANYRRLLGDRHWLFTTPLSDIGCYFPAPFAALRTLKSEVVAGLQLEQVEMLDREDPQWLTNGQRGVIQFVDPPPSP